MVKSVGARGIDFSQLEADLRRAGDGQGNVSEGSLEGELAGVLGGSSAGGAGKPKFLDMLKDGIKEVNSAVKGSEKASMDLVSGKSSNIHETMLAVSKAEIGFNMLVQMRNKAIEAYQDVMRMQV